MKLHALFGHVNITTKVSLTSYFCTDFFFLSEIDAKTIGWAILCSISTVMIITIWLYRLFLQAISHVESNVAIKENVRFCCRRVNRRHPNGRTLLHKLVSNIYCNTCAHDRAHQKDDIATSTHHRTDEHQLTRSHTNNTLLHTTHSRHISPTHWHANPKVARVRQRGCLIEYFRPGTWPKLPCSSHACTTARCIMCVGVCVPYCDTHIDIIQAHTQIRMVVADGNGRNGATTTATASTTTFRQRVCRCRRLGNITHLPICILCTPMPPPMRHQANKGAGTHKFPACYPRPTHVGVVAVVACLWTMCASHK